ncbi:MAG: int [Thermoleophilia bacterium]|nr:int [Thermoleophilia bacterium]
MSPSYEKTRYPGIYRRGDRFSVRQRDAAGRLVNKSAQTIAEARTIQASLRTSQASGEHVPKSIAFAAYADEWITSYVGRTGRGFRETTRDDYRAALRLHIKPFFGRMRLTEIQPRDIKAFAFHLAGSGLSEASVRRYMGPLKALLATAFEDGLIRVNPATNVRTAVPRTHDDREHAKALSAEQLQRLIAAVDEEWRPLIEFMATTGLRIGEVVALRWGDVDLDRGVFRVQRAFYKGNIDEPKSRFGKRRIPLSPKLAAMLRDRDAQLQPSPKDPVFQTLDGTMMDPANIRSRIMRPAAARAGLAWATPHTLRHTFASRCFRQGCNVKQVQALLGHHSPSFTLETYVHLLPEDLPDLAFLD